MPHSLPPPRVEGAVRLPRGRRLGYAEFGPASGRPLLWFHGTPGARLQIAPSARELAHERGVRIVSVERPGVGDSTPHVYDAVVDFASDVERVCEALGIERFAVGGLSGGGPYALACAHELQERVVAAALLGGVAPAAGPDAAPGGASGLMRALAPLVSRAHRPLGNAVRGLIHLLEPLADPVIHGFARVMMAPGDQRVFADPAMHAMFKQDLLLGGRRQMQAIFLDVALFARHWGFELGDLAVPVHLWAGDADTIVPLHHGEHLARRIPGARLRVRPEEGHLGCLGGAAAEVFDAILGHWPDETPAPAPSRRRPARRREAALT